jgi:hypothetical protein
MISKGGTNMFSKKFRSILFLALWLLPLLSLAAQTPEEKIISIEKKTLDRWKNGDTFGFIEAAAEDITYFDPTLAVRIDGLRQFRDYLAPMKGTFSFPSYELLNPKVQLYGDIGVLTFNFVGHSEDGKTDAWNTTEVYRRVGNEWKIVSSHWSKTKPQN